MILQEFNYTFAAKIKYVSESEPEICGSCNPGIRAPRHKLGKKGEGYTYKYVGLQARQALQEKGCDIRIFTKTPG